MSLTVFLAVLFFSFPLYAQEYKIIKTKGQVLIREDESKPWQKAKKGYTLSENYELMTKRGGECTFAAGDTINKALTLKQNSQLKVSAESMGRLELIQGRVFSLIEKMDQGSTYEIQTPVAIAGARGTGWTVEADKDTSVKCFEGEVYVKGLDEEGNVIADKDIPEGSGVQVKEKGEIEKPFEVSKKDKKEWNSFRDIVKDFIGKPIGKVFNAFGGITEGVVEGYLGSEGENPFNR
ncbi:MAG: FecR family protein [Candidatus Omnitrophota bacterium]